MRQFTQIGLTKIAIVPAVLLVACIAAMGQEVHSNSMPGVNFARYHTYKWATVAGGPNSNQIIDAEIKQAVDAQLAAKGLTRTDSDQADLYIGYKTGLDQEKEWNAWGSGGGPFWGGMGIGSATSSMITNGSLVLDMYDPATKQLVWTGTATKTLNPSGNQQKNVRSLDKAVQKLLKNYPPKYS
jgi:hypothetical protein